MPAVTRIVAVGAGRSGRGIAQVFAYAGYAVSLLDLKQRADEEARTLLAEAKREIAENLGFLQSLDILDGDLKETILDRITGAVAADAPGLLSEADYVFECVPEVLDAKRDALGRISDAVGSEAIIASTTSTMLVDQLAEFVAAPERFLNAHWLNPAYLIPLVEVSPGDQTAPATLDKVMALLRGIGKVPVRCNAAPGYIVPRIQAVAMNEAARMVEEGVATPEDIDRAVRAGFGIRFATMGLVEFIDWGGVDILYYASNYLREALSADRFAPPDVVRDHMAAGKLGLKSGDGFYDFAAMDVEGYRREKMQSFVALLRHLDLMPRPATETGKSTTGRNRD